MKKGIIFDMDGTLFDTERLYQASWKAVTEEFGQVFNPAFPPAVSGSSGENLYRIIHEFYPDVDEKAFLQGCLDHTEAQLQVAVPEKPGVKEILAYVKDQGYKIAIASSGPIHVIENNLRLAGIRDYFESIASGHEVTKGKPDPDVFLLAAERLGIKASECYIIEDSANGIRGAHASGAAAIMVPDCVAPTEETRKLCVGVYDSLIEVMEAIKKEEI